MSDPIFKPGDYIVGKDTIYMLIVAVVAGKPPVYATKSVKQADHLHWITESEIVAHNWWAGTPDFAAFDSIKVDDIVQMGTDGYMKVLARVGDAVLLSQMPDENAGLILDVTEAMKEQFGVPVIPPMATADLKDARSSYKSFQRAGMWHDVTTLALMNWKLVPEEHHEQ